MPSRCTLSEYAAKKRVTRGDRFLAEIKAVTPWLSLTNVIAPYYPSRGSGRPARPAQDPQRRSQRQGESGKGRPEAAQRRAGRTEQRMWFERIPTAWWVAGAVLLLKPIGGDRTKGRDESDFSGDY